MQLVLLACFLVVGGCAAASVGGSHAALLPGIGDTPFGRRVSTSNPMAQRFFNQGWTLYFGFNHAEAARSFAEAARLDERLAMAHYGRTLSLGPNVNDFHFDEERLRHVYQALLPTLHLLPEVDNDVERALIAALQQRYRIENDSVVLDAQAYADAMTRVNKAYGSNDSDVATLFASAVMNLSPWNYWQADGKTGRPGIDDAVVALEAAMERTPDHIGANHFFIHIIESTDAQRAVPAADRLVRLVSPGTGHLMHMPSHIYIVVGRYADAVDANLRAIAADEEYIEATQAQGLYPMGYFPHNIQFLQMASSWEGNESATVDAAHRASALISSLRDPRVVVYGLTPSVLPYWAVIRFGRWSDVLDHGDSAAPKHVEGTNSAVVVDFPQAIYHYARGLGLCARGRLAEAQEELVELEKRRADIGSQSLVQMASVQLRIAALNLDAEMAAKKGQFQLAVARLRDAVRLEERLPYYEPPMWHMPVRHRLGAVLLEAGRAQEAAQVYEQDLEKHPHNGWALFGLAQAKRAMGDDEGVRDVERQFREAWQRADVVLTSSRF